MSAPELAWKQRLPFDILDLPGTIARHRAHLQKRPNDAIAHANLVMALDLADKVPTEKAMLERRRFYETHCAKFARGDKPHGNLLDPERRLKVGYISADFRQHSAMYAIAPVIGYHDRNNFAVYVYSSTRPQDHYTQAIQGSADRFHDVHGWSDAQVAYLIEAEGIDVLVDCSGHTGGFRLETLARKPAPIQLSAFGYPNGTGLPQVDYLVADAVYIPESERGLYVERILDMPCLLTYQAPPYTPEVSALPSSANGAIFCFGVLNRVEKISDACLRAWSAVMRAVQPSKILIKDRHLSDRNTRRTLIRRMVAAGIPESAIDLRGVTHHQGQLLQFHEVDVQLDTYPQGGGMSTAEAVYMGVPVLTLKGHIPASRAASAILTAIGHPEWIATNEREYVEKAIALASDRAALAEIRAKLRADVTASPFGNPQIYTRMLEQKMREMWREYCERTLLAWKSRRQASAGDMP